MFAPQHDFFLAINNARKAARRGDISATERWLKAAERHTLIAERMALLSGESLSPRGADTRPPWLRRG